MKHCYSSLNAVAYTANPQTNNMVIGKVLRINSFFLLKTFLLTLLSVVVGGNVWGQNQTYTAGTTVYIFKNTGASTLSSIPNGTIVKIECIGGGGGGGGVNSSSSNDAASGGGGGGGYAYKSYTFSATGNLSVTVGTGGAGGTNSPTDGGDGTPSFVSLGGTELVRASGGSKGLKGSNSAGNGGNGGTNVTGDGGKSGGKGGNGWWNSTYDVGGGGGGAGGPVTIGGEGGGGGSTGKSCSDVLTADKFKCGGDGGGTIITSPENISAGAGGRGSSSNGSSGGNAVLYGGGGAGAGAWNNKSAGTAGAQGVVVITITYVVPACTTPTTQTMTSNTTCTSGSGATIGLVNSQSGVTYELYRGGTTLVETKKSTANGAFSFNNLQTTAGTYTVKVKAVDGYCAADMSGSIILIAPPSITSQPVNTTICAKTGGTGSYAVTVSNATGLTFEWQYSTDGNNPWNPVTGIPQIASSTSGNTNTMTITAPPAGWNGFHIRCKISNGSCDVFSTVRILDIDPVGEDGSLTAATATTVCLGSPIAVNASGGDGTPRYWISSDGGVSWNVLAQQIPNYNTTGYTYTPTTAGTYIIHGRWENSCGFCWDELGFDWGTTTRCKGALNTIVTFTVSDYVPASVNITSNPTGAICSGTSVTFTPTPTNGGASPSYQWKVNGSNAGTGTTYTSSGLSNNDKITVVMTSNASCVTGSPATSNEITMSVNTNPTPSFTSVSPSANICEGTNVTYTTQAGQNNYTWNFTGTGGGVDYTVISGGTGSNTAVVSWKNATNAVATVNYQNASGCVGTTPASSTPITLNKPTALSGNETATCYVNGNNRVHFYTPSGYIGAINPLNKDLGNVTMTSYVGNPKMMVACNAPANTTYHTAYLGRSWDITAPNFVFPVTFGGDVQVNLPFMQTELDDLNSPIWQNTLTPNNPNDGSVSLSNIMLTKISGGTVDGQATLLGDCSGTIKGITAIQGSGTSIQGISANYVAFNITEFSEFFLHKNQLNSGSPLPITLTSFAGNCNDNGVQLAWTTATETNVNHFEIYRSRNGQSWEKVADVSAVGNSSTANTYYATDERGIETMYYKLRSVDNDGTYEDFNPIAVKCDIKGQTWSLHPVPAETQVTITIETDKVISDNIVITDMNGRTIQTQTVNLEIGTNYIMLDVQHFAKGTYMVKMNNETEYKPLKLMKID